MRFYATTLVAAVMLVLAAPADARTVHLYGDSISSGWGFGTYAHPSFLNRIDRIANQLARANGSRLVFRRAGFQDPAAICRDVAQGRVKRTDRVVFEDAGPHTDQALGYRRWLELVVFCSTYQRGPAAAKRLTLTTMFDYVDPTQYGGLACYDRLLPDGSGMTINAVTRSVARRYRTGLLDWNRRMDDAVTALSPLGVRLVHPDGIHPTVFGNIVLAVSLLRREGVRVGNVEPVVRELVAQKWYLIGSASPDFDRAEASAWMRRLAGPA